MIRLADESHHTAISTLNVRFDSFLHFGSYTETKRKTGLDFADREWTRRLYATFFEMNHEVRRQTRKVNGGNNIVLGNAMAQGRDYSADGPDSRDFVRQFARSYDDDEITDTGKQLPHVF